MNKLHAHLGQSGFTLIEALVALAIVAVLSALAVPSLASFGERMNLGTFTDDVLAHLHLARGEAIKRRGRVALCKSADGETCAGAGGWEQGWIVFHDADNNGMRTDGELVVERMGALPAGWRLTGNSSLARYISYHPSGTTRYVSGAFQAGTLTLCRQSAWPTHGVQIVLNAAGRPRTNKVMLPACA